MSLDGSDQIIDLKTDLEAGRLLLHWGVEGGRNYKGGWRLPGGECRPEGTQQYKDRALQTPFRCVQTHKVFCLLQVQAAGCSGIMWLQQCQCCNCNKPQQGACRSS